MRRTIVALTLALALSTGHAQPASDVEQFRTLTAAIVSDPTVAGQWVILLPVIAQQCGMAVDHERVAVLVNGFGDPDAVDEAADYFASGSAGSLKATWDAIAKRDQDEACRLADFQWGDAGTLFPGVLHDMSEAAERMISQHATVGRTR